MRIGLQHGWQPIVAHGQHGDGTCSPRHRSGKTGSVSRLLPFGAALWLDGVLLRPTTGRQGGKSQRSQTFEEGSARYGTAVGVVHV